MNAGTRKELQSEQCDALWHRIQVKKWTFTFGRDHYFNERCGRIQQRLNTIVSLWRYRTSGIEVDCPLQGHIIALKHLTGEQCGNRKS